MGEYSSATAPCAVAFMAQRQRGKRLLKPIGLSNLRIETGRPEVKTQGRGTCGPQIRSKGKRAEGDESPMSNDIRNI